MKLNVALSILKGSYSSTEVIEYLCLLAISLMYSVPNTVGTALGESRRRCPVMSTLITGTIS